jgi:glycosyltransferase involved in cell wall biosynthesis
VVRGGFDLAPFEQAGAERPAAVPPRRLVFAGRVDPRKGLETAVEGMARAGLGQELVVAGPVDDEAYRGRVEQLAGRLGVADRVHWRGPLPRGELPALFSSNDAMVYPSAEPESYGLGLIEAMAARRPVITSALGGPREYLRDGENALLFEPGDADALAARLRRLDDEPGLVGGLADAGASTAAGHSLEPVVDRIEELLSGAVRAER